MEVRLFYVPREENKSPEYCCYRPNDSGKGSLTTRAYSAEMLAQHITPHPNDNYNPGLPPDSKEDWRPMNEWEMGQVLAALGKK